MVPLWNSDSFGLALSMSILALASTWLIASVLINTYYWLDNDKVHWRTGPFKGSIDSNKITKVTRADSLMDISAMVKPCLTAKPLLIRYNQYDDLAVSPKEEEEFLNELRKLNAAISVNV